MHGGKISRQFPSASISAKWLCDKLGPITAPDLQLFPSVMRLLCHVEVTRPKPPTGEWQGSCACSLTSGGWEINSCDTYATHRFLNSQSSDKRNKTAQTHDAIKRKKEVIAESRAFQPLCKALGLSLACYNLKARFLLNHVTCKKALPCSSAIWPGDGATHTGAMKSF